jgi:hypothetical protein
MKTARRKANLVVLSGIAVPVLLYRFPPEQYSFYPVCPVYRYLHIYCPGCGSTRALAALLHGRIIDAMHYNPLFVMLFPLLVAFGVMMYWKAAVKNEIQWPQLPKPALTFLLAVVAVFAVARNL